jgi:hypothetical protein
MSSSDALNDIKLALESIKAQQELLQSKYKEIAEMQEKAKVEKVETVETVEKDKSNPDDTDFVIDLTASISSNQSILEMTPPLAIPLEGKIIRPVFAKKPQPNIDLSMEFIPLEVKKDSRIVQFDPRKDDARQLLSVRRPITPPLPKLLRPDTPIERKRKADTDVNDYKKEFEFKNPFGLYLDNYVIRNTHKSPLYFTNCTFGNKCKIHNCRKTHNELFEVTEEQQYKSVVFYRSVSGKQYIKDCIFGDKCTNNNCKYTHRKLIKTPEYDDFCKKNIKIQEDLLKEACYAESYYREKRLRQEAHLDYFVKHIDSDSVF